MPRVLRGRRGGGAHDDRDGRDHWIAAVSAEAMPAAASPNAVAESIQHSQQSKSERLRVSAGIARVAWIACCWRSYPRRLRVRGVNGRRHPRRGDPYRSPHCQSARACTSTGGTSAAAAASLSCSVRCNSWAWVRRGRWQFPTTGFKWRDLPARRGGGYDLSRSLAAGVTTSRRELRPVAVPRGGSDDLAAGVTTCRGPSRRGLRPRGGSRTSLRDAHRPPRVGVSPATRPDREQVPHCNHPATPGRTHQPSR